MKIWLLLIDHESGVNSYACKNEEIAKRFLSEYVREN